MENLGFYKIEEKGRRRPKKEKGEFPTLLAASKRLFQAPKMFLLVKKEEGPKFS